MVINYLDRESNASALRGLALLFFPRANKHIDMNPSGIVPILFIYFIKENFETQLQWANLGFRVKKRNTLDF